MTQVAPMQNLNDNVQMFPTDTNTGGVNIPASETHVDSYKPLDSGCTSLEDYNHTMLLYTQRQMSAFVGESDRGSGRSGRSGRSSQSSGQSGQSSRSNESTASGGARNANGPPPSAPAGSRISERDMADDESASY